MIERSGSGSTSLTNGSGCGHMDPTDPDQDLGIRNTDSDSAVSHFLPNFIHSSHLFCMPQAWYLHVICLKYQQLLSIVKHKCLLFFPTWQKLYMNII